MSAAGFGCRDRKRMLRSRQPQESRRERARSISCAAPGAEGGYLFLQSHGKSGIYQRADAIYRRSTCPWDFPSIKIEGRGLGSALVLEFLLYYMTKPGVPAARQGRNLSGQYAGSVLTIHNRDFVPATYAAGVI